MMSLSIDSTEISTTIEQLLAEGTITWMFLHETPATRDAAEHLASTDRRDSDTPEPEGESR